MEKAEDNQGRKNTFVGVMDENMKEYYKQGTFKYILLGLCIAFSFFIFISLALTPTASATLYYVNPGESILAAVNNASDGDTIVVRDGTYTENIDVNKRLTIQSENGSASTTVQATNTNDSVFEVTADYVNISGFTVKNSICLYCAGISLNDVDHCNISYNNASNNKRGINSSSSNFNMIAENTIMKNKGEAICLYYGSNYNRIVSNTISNNTWGVWIGGYGFSSHNIVSDNVITDTTQYGAINVYGNATTNNTILNNTVLNNMFGIFFKNSSTNTVINNTVANNALAGIGLHSSSNNIVEGNNASNNYGEIDLGGICLYLSDNNRIRKNIALNNSYNGVCLGSSNNNIIENNTASNNTYGIYLQESTGNIIENNNIVSNNYFNGIYLFSSFNNTIGNNIASNNSYGIYLESSLNNTVKNNNASFNEYFGIFLHSSNYNTITGNCATSNYAGIDLCTSSDHNIIRNNDASCNGDGIHLSSSDCNMITDNYATSNRVTGISLSDLCSNNTIRNNNASNNKNFGIFLGSSSYNTITGNYASTNNGSGISLGDFSSNNTVINNTANYNLLGGIDLSDSSDYNTISNNDACSNKYGSISLSSSDCNTISNNNASSNEDECASLSLHSSDYNTIAGNYVNSNNGTGILLWNSSINNTIKNNTANFNKYFGMLLHSSDYNTITSNYANSNYDGIGIWNSSDCNTIRNNNATFNEAFGTLLFSSNSNIVSNNDLSSNSFGLVLYELVCNTRNNQIRDNNLNYNKYCGIFLWDLQYVNNIFNNNASNNNLFGIFVLNSTRQAIRNNTANSNERGIGLRESSAIKLTNNTADANEISGLSLINSSDNSLHNNLACFNTYEGIYLSNSSTNDISANNVSSNYFGISLYSSNNNTIINNTAESNYYSEVFLHPDKWNNTIENNTLYIQKDTVMGVRLYVLEAVTPSLQIVENGTNATYYIVAENLGNSPDTFDLSVDNPEISSLDTSSVFLGAGEISANTTTTEVESQQISTVKMVKPSVKTITLNVSDTAPGIYGVKVAALSRNDNTVKDVIETRTIVPGQVASVLINSPKITKSAIIKSSIKNSIINTSAIINSIISNSTITGSIINNSEVVNTSLNDVIVEDANISNGNISCGDITINEIKYEISNETRISELIIGSDYSDSNLVGITKTKTLNVYAENSNVSFDIYAEKDYFAGSMSVQKSTIPPNGIPEFTNNVGGYVYANASDNLANSTGWLIIKVFYNQNELGNLTESSLRLRYFNENAGLWENISIYGVNLTGKYVWGNISRYSVFALIAQPAVPSAEPPPSYGGGRRLPEEVTILIANPGINTFNFEWLCHDIIKVSIDLKSMTINAKVSLKKVDKPAEFPDLPGIVYGYFDISTSLESDNIKSANINFRVRKSWIDANDVATIKMWRYVSASGWEELRTERVKDDDNYFYYSAETSGLSLFAIAGERKAEEFAPPAMTPTPPVLPTASPTPIPVVPAMVSLIRLLIIVAIVASAVAVSVALLRRRKKKSS